MTFFFRLSLINQYVISIIPNIGNEDINKYGNIAKRVDGSKIFNNTFAKSRYLFYGLILYQSNFMISREPSKLHPHHLDSRTSE